LKKNGIISLIGILILILALLAGCSAAATEQIEETIDHHLDTAEDAAEVMVLNILSTEPPSPPVTEAPAPLTAEEAKAIALEHAGFTSDQVSRLRAEFDWDDGVPTWDVEFREGYWEYDYEIHAETGKIRSFDKDD